MGSERIKNGWRRTHVGYWWEDQKERDHKQGKDVGGCIILISILEK
jgi:hypothetical protein